MTAHEFAPVSMQHRIEFSTAVEDSVGSFEHSLIANGVIQRLEKLGPLMVEEAVLKERLKEVQRKMREVTGERGDL
ncbi:hypothetical protein IB265_32990 [Ensifer sp. ENS10]|uniref:hypothetical protein n=1 Tax=Ensifer sp. ENS10 TaxID=2769286 RepID=UPI0017821321|nr:hypothetical protein [Ensifer sp. ENS10]MBD9511574.1 hypothetical protein [Ensifer sp. ENS10]